METQKGVNLLNDTDNESSKLATRKWHVINDKIIENMVMEVKMIQLLNFKQKLLNQDFVIIQMHISL